MRSCSSHEHDTNKQTTYLLPVGLFRLTRICVHETENYVLGNSAARKRGITQNFTSELSPPRPNRQHVTCASREKVLSTLFLDPRYKVVLKLSNPIRHLAINNLNNSVVYMNFTSPSKKKNRPCSRYTLVIWVYFFIVSCQN